MDCFVASLLAMTVDTVSPSRGADRPRFAINFSPSRKLEGAGKTGCAPHPRSRVQFAHSKNAHEHTGSAETPRPSLRNGFTAYSELSPVNGSFATVVAQDQSPPQLDASTAASGPHDFAVRLSRARQSQLSRPSVVLICRSRASTLRLRAKQISSQRCRMGRAKRNPSRSYVR